MISNVHKTSNPLIEQCIKFKKERDESNIEDTEEPD